MASTPVKSPDSEGSSSSESWKSWSMQLNAYMAWINSQLKKKPGARMVEDMRNDTRDGVAFIDLIEVVAGERLSGVHLCPSSTTEMKENVDRVLHFMSSKKIRMHHIASRDIVEGNLKSIMRLILALAAHYKPKSVKHSSQHSGSGSRSPNVAGIAQGASATLTAARRTVAKAGSSLRRHRDYRERRRYQESSSDQYSDSDQSFSHDRSHDYRGHDRGEVDGASASSSPTQSTVHSPQSSIVTSTPKAETAETKNKEHINSKDSGTELEDSAGQSGVDKGQLEDLLHEYMVLSEEMKPIKEELSSLQDLLLSGQPPDGAETKMADSVDMIEGATPEEEIIILRSRLQQSKEVCSCLREELSKTKLECMQIQGSKSGAQQRLSDQDEKISQLKAEILKRDFEKQKFDSEKASLHKQIQDKEKLITDLRRDVARRDQRIDMLQNEIRNEKHEKEMVTRSLKSQIQDLHERFRVVGETGASLSARVASQDKKMAKLAGKILQTHHTDTSNANSTSKEFPRHPPTGADEIGVIRDALHSLRHSFAGTDPSQHTIDTLEQGISTLVERVSPGAANNSRSSSGSMSPYDNPNVSRRLNFDSTGDVRRSPITAIPGSHNTRFSINHLDNPPSSMNNQEVTRVLYHTDKTVTPMLCTICKRLGEITLRDFKEIVDKSGGPYRYHFKALDPEFGTVKEEVINDEAILPGWEGKIVAWVEEDTGQI